MDSIKTGIITLIKSAITGEKLALPQEFSIADAANICRKHNIYSLIYYGALNCGISKNDPVMNDLFNKTCANVLLNEQQAYNLGCIFEEFEKKKIDYMPLKGTLLKKLYPKPEIRIMGDADILIKTEQYDIIKSIMQDLGYNEVLESDHELKWSKKSMVIELHKRLIPSYNKDYYSYFGDGWRLGRLQNSNSTRYEMSKDDNMIYIFTHFAKHYRDSGIGIRYIVDLWVYRNSFKDLNEDYIKKELEKLQLYDFYVNVNRTIDNWFCGAPSDSVTELITGTIFNSGVYGTEESRILSEALKLSKKMGRKNVRLANFLHLVFLPLDDMKVKFPILNKLPILLPFMWIFRIFNVLFLKKKYVKDQVKQYKISKVENIENYGDALNFVGLDFNFKE